MPTPIYLVKVGMNMTEGVVEEWYIADGATVTKGELLYRLETEKVNLDVDAEVDGTVRHVVGEGITMKPGDVVGYIYAAGEQIPATLDAAAATHAADALAEAATAPAAAPPPTQKVAAAIRGDGGRILASPAARRLAIALDVELELVTGTGPSGRIVEADVQAAATRAPDASDATTAGGDRAGPSSPIARKLARELGIDLAAVTGTGPGGRITKEDVERSAAEATRRPAPVAAASTAPAAAPVVGAKPDQTLPIRGMRKTIAARMHESLTSMAQLTMNMDVVMDDAVRLRKQLLDEWQEQGLRITYTDLVIRAAAKALEKHPLMNSVFGEREMTLKGAINVGMAVAVEDGLLVPVVQNANLRGMREIVAESSRLAAAAREGRLSVDDLQGGTFTVTALGMYGVDSFTPIINAPQVGILGVNRIRDEVAWDGATPVKQQRMTLSLTWDHRAVDGAPAAAFLGTVRDLLEAPFRLLV
jgi:pyruvate/2-oxoglutarate dehydrogenase complex dihydrolipoamide acyltransferase (E2) component